MALFRSGRRIFIDVLRVRFECGQVCEQPPHLNFPSLLIYRRPSRAFRCTPQLVSQPHMPSSTLLSLTDATPIHNAEHDCKGVPCRRRSATEILGMPPFCRPMAIILSFLHLLSRHTTYVAGVPSCSTHADQPDIESGSASDSNAPVGFASTLQIVHTCALSVRTSPGPSPRHGLPRWPGLPRTAEGIDDATVWTR